MKPTLWAQEFTVDVKVALDCTILKPLLNFPQTCGKMSAIPRCDSFWQWRDDTEAQVFRSAWTTQKGSGMKTPAVKFGALEVVLCVREQEVTARYQINNVAMVISFSPWWTICISPFSICPFPLFHLFRWHWVMFPIVMQNPIIEILKFYLEYLRIQFKTLCRWLCIHS